MKVCNTIDMYEVNGEKIGRSSDAPKIKIRSHWLRKEFVVLEIGSDKYTVLARELEKAIRNATNF